VSEALKEVREAIGSANKSEVGPASLELAVRAAYPLVVSGRLNADRGSNNNNQPDRRTPGEVLDAMRQTPQGVLQLAQALADYATGDPIRAVDDDGAVKRLADQSGDQTVSDVYLRGEYPPAGKARAQRPGDTPTDRFHNRLNNFASSLDQLKQTFDAVCAVVGDDGRSLVDATGVDYRSCETWRECIGGIDEELVVWARTFKRAYGTVSERRATSSPTVHPEDSDERPEVYADDYEESQIAE
jgi:hypothetical protein